MWLRKAVLKLILIYQFEKQLLRGALLNNCFEKLKRLFRKINLEKRLFKKFI